MQDIWEVQEVGGDAAACPGGCGAKENVHA